MIEKRQFDPVVVPFQEDVVRIQFAVHDPAGVQVTRRLRHLSGNADGGPHSV